MASTPSRLCREAGRPLSATSCCLTAFKPFFESSSGQLMDRSQSSRDVLSSHSAFALFHGSKGSRWNLRDDSGAPYEPPLRPPVPAIHRNSTCGSSAGQENFDESQAL